MFEKIKNYYKKGFYKTEHLKKLLQANAITQEEYEKILTCKTENE